MASEHRSEQEFLIKYAVDRFNTQYGKKFPINAFSIRQIDKGKYAKVAYEITTVREDDYLRLRIYIKFDRFDALGKYRLELEENLYIDGLGDEVYVAEGTIANAWLDNGIYRFREWTTPFTPGDFILVESGVTMLTEDGEMMFLEHGVE